MLTVGFMTTASAREAATAHLQQADAAINAMFDRLDDLNATLTKVSEHATSDANVFARSQHVVDAAVTIAEQLEALRAAALAASEYRAKRDLARDLEAGPGAVFPTSSRATADEGGAEPEVVDAA